MAHLYLEVLQQHVQAGHISRRGFIKRGLALGFSLPVVSAALAACGGDDDDDDDGDSGAGAEEEPTATSGEVTIRTEATPTEDTGEEPEPTPTEAPAGEAGGRVTFSRQADSDNLDPVLNDGNINIWLFMNIYDQPVKVSEDGTTLIPGIATEWEVSDDGLTYTFTIREGVKFFDGSDMTVEDIIWSIERAKSHPESIWTFSLEALDEITAPDESTIVMMLNQPWAPFLADLAMFNSSVISKAYVEEVGEEALVDHTMGTGSFHLQEWNKAENMTLVRNPNYWEEGLPLLDEIFLTVVPDGNSQILQLQGGEIDGIIGQGDLAFNRIADLEADANIQIINSLSTWNNFVVLNTRNSPLDDVKVRQALNYAADKGALIDTVLFGYAEPSNSFMPVGALYWNADQEGYPFDLDRAKELIAESEHTDGFMIEFQIRSGNQQQLQIATALKEMWSQIGAEVEISQLEQGVYSDNYRNNEFEARLSGWTNDIIDPDQLNSYAILPELTENYHTGWTNQEAIDLANEGRAELDQEKRREIYARIQELHMQDAPFIYLYVLPYIDALSSRVQGFFHHPMGHYIFKNMSVEE